jgi:hypothetical protein
MPKEQIKKIEDLKKLPLEDYIRLLPSPPEEHSHELKMEKHVKELLKKQRKK